MSKWIIALVLACPIFAQDCIIRFDFVASGASTPFNNQQTQCTNWTLGYFSSGFSAVSIQLESAPPGANSSVPGTFVIWAGTVVNGTHPSTNTAQGQVYLNGLFPWVRVNLSSITGTGEMIGAIYGYKVASQQFPIAGGAAACGVLLTPSCVPPSSYSFTNRFLGNGGTVTNNSGADNLLVQPTNASGDTNGFYARDIPIPTTPYSFTMAFSGCGQHSAAGPEFGIYISDGTKFVGFDAFPSGAASPEIKFQIIHCTTRAAASCTAAVTANADTVGVACASPMFVKLVDDGVNVEMQWSSNGYKFMPIANSTGGIGGLMKESRTAFLTPTLTGYFMIPDNGNYWSLLNVLSFAQGTN